MTIFCPRQNRTSPMMSLLGGETVANSIREEKKKVRVPKRVPRFCIFYQLRFAPRGFSYLILNDCLHTLFQSTHSLTHGIVNWELTKNKICILLCIEITVDILIICFVLRRLLDATLSASPDIWHSLSALSTTKYQLYKTFENGFGILPLSRSLISDE